MTLTLDAVPQTRELSSSSKQDDALPDVSLIPADRLNALLQLFKLLADETRLQILHILRQRTEVNVLTLCQLLGLRQPSVSHHLALLREHKLIEMRRAGKHNFYRVLPERLAEYLQLVSTPAEDGHRKIRLGGKMTFELVLQREVS